VSPDVGGQTAAVMYTLLGTARLNGINALPSNRAGVLLPWVVRIGDVEVHQLKLHRKPVMNRPGIRGGSNSREWSHEEVPEVFT
jgi:hypothetical protein